MNIKNVTENLQRFSSRACWDDELEALSKKCKGLKILNIGCLVGVLHGDMDPILKFKHLEELIIYSETFYTPHENLSKALTHLSRSKALDKEGIRIHCTLSLKIFGCDNPEDHHVRLFADRLPNLTSVSLCFMKEVNLTPLRDLKYLRTFSLKHSHFNLVSDLLQAVGEQLRCLDMSDICDIDLKFIGKNCSSLMCFHLFNMKSCSNIQDIAEKLSLPEFPSVHYLHLKVGSEAFMEYIMSRYVNVRQLCMKEHSGFHSLFETVLHRKHLKLLEQFFWGIYTVVQVLEKYAVIASSSGGKISVHSVEI